MQRMAFRLGSVLGHTGTATRETLRDARASQAQQKSASAKFRRRFATNRRYRYTAPRVYTGKRGAPRSLRRRCRRCDQLTLAVLTAEPLCPTKPCPRWSYWPRHPAPPERPPGWSRSKSSRCRDRADESERLQSTHLVPAREWDNRDDATRPMLRSRG